MAHPYTRLFRSTTAPTVDDDSIVGHEIGDIWVDQTGGQSYQAMDVTVGAAVWEEITGGGGYTPPATTAANDFQVGDGSGNWIKKTLAQTITILRTSLDSVYAAVSHSHAWGTITGTLSSQSDLQSALDGKLDDSQLEDAINNGETTKAPTENAVFDALALKLPTSYLDTDTALAANSDVKIASQKAVKTYVDALIGANDAMVYKGVIDCSANPNYPAADAGHLYKVSVAGKIGGASGPNVEVGDSILCSVDSTASGNHATVGSSWSIIQVNIDGAVTGPASSTSGNIVTFNGAGGKVVQDGGVTIASLETGTQIHAAASATILNADEIGFWKSSGSLFKKDTWANFFSQISGSLIGVFADYIDFIGHTHDNGTTAKITQANSHQTPDTDSGTSSLHHTIGGGANQAAAGNHTHTSREILAATRTYYVRTDGSDSNTGLVDSAGGAFLTIQKAIDVVAALDIQTYAVTIQVKDGTYTGATLVNGPWLGSGVVTVQGNSGTPANVLISTTSSNCFTVQNGGSLTVKDMELRTTTFGICLFATLNGGITFTNIRFGQTATYHMDAINGGSITASGNYTITNGAIIHMISDSSGTIRLSGKTVTLTKAGTIAFTIYAYAQIAGSVIADSMTFTIVGGTTVTGQRYNITTNGVVFVNGAASTYLPGSTAGAVASGGQYA